MIFVVRMEHPDGEEWGQYVAEHVSYLRGLITRGHLLASGPVKGSVLRAGLLIFRAESEQQVRQWIEDDPFSRENLIVTLDICQWDPLFGCLSEVSSGLLPPVLQDQTAG